MPLSANDQVRVQQLLQTGGASTQAIRAGLLQGGYSPAEVDQGLQAGLAGLKTAQEDNSKGPLSDFFAGVGSGAAQTGDNIYQLLRRVPGLQSLPPDAVQRLFSPGTSYGAGQGGIAASTPQTLPAQLGHFAEQAGEFMYPAAKVGEAVRGGGLLSRLLAQGATGATVSVVRNPDDLSQIRNDAVLGAGGEMLPYGWEKFAKALKVGSPDWYLHKLNLPNSISLEDQRAVAGMGLEGHLPIGSQKSVDVLGKVTQPGTVLGDFSDAVDQALQKSVNPQPAVAKLGQVGYSTAGQQSIDPRKAFAPLTDYIASLRSSKGLLKEGGTGGVEYENQLKREMQSYFEQWGGKIDSNGQITKMPDLSVNDAQDFKKSIYKRISERQYADNADQSTVTAQKQARELMARGLKNEINRLVPEVAPLNEGMHHAIMLQDAMTDAVKANPSKMGDALQWALGFGLAGHAVIGGPIGASTAGLVALAARKALIEPATASRLAMVFHDQPSVLRSIGDLARSGLWAGRQALVPSEDQTSNGPGGQGGNLIQGLLKAPVQR